MEKYNLSTYKYMTLYNAGLLRPVRIEHPVPDALIPRQRAYDHYHEFHERLFREYHDRPEVANPRPVNPVVNHVVPKPIEDVETEDEKFQCVVCMSNKRIIAFNCGHLSCCNGCSQRLEKCPICQVEITTKTHIFIP